MEENSECERTGDRFGSYVAAKEKDGSLSKDNAPKCGDSEILRFDYSGADLPGFSALPDDLRVGLTGSVFSDQSTAFK